MLAKLINKVSTAVKTVISPTYDRASFVSASFWTKTRKLIVRRDKIEDQWICKYSGTIITNQTDIDVDHIIPLKYAWLHGASKWTFDKRKEFAVDPENLISVTEHENRSKGDDGLILYLPLNNKAFYVTQWKTMAEKYGIKLTRVEKKIIKQYAIYK